MSRKPEVDDIRTTHHPHSKRSPTVESFATYGQTTHSRGQASCIKAKPWLPFHSESEFEFARIILETAMSHPQVTALIKVVQKIIAGDTFKVKSHKEIDALWELAASRLSPVHMFFS